MLAVKETCLTQPRLFARVRVVRIDLAIDVKAENRERFAERMLRGRSSNRLQQQATRAINRIRREASGRRTRRRPRGSRASPVDERACARRSRESDYGGEIEILRFSRSRETSRPRDKRTIAARIIETTRHAISAFASLTHAKSHHGRRRVAASLASSRNCVSPIRNFFFRNDTHRDTHPHVSARSRAHNGDPMRTPITDFYSAIRSRFEHR